ncbi:MAG: choice-of-anchor J domain-containing protein, partial [Lachnospiraceae bacterium]|nr:choice-of-anchor J domain-containing protein [Lachnospiraceae bacterium]
MNRALYDTVFCPPDPDRRTSCWHEDFETDPAAKGWTFVDADGDSHNWSWYLSEGEYNHLKNHSGIGVITSASYDNDAGEPLDPDNWAISPAVYVPEGSDLSFWAVGQDYYDWAEVYSVYIGESGVPAEMELLAGDLVTTDEYRNIILDLSAWEGKTVHIAFRHYNVTDQYKLNIDDVDIGISAAREPHVFGEEGNDRYVCQNCGWVNGTLKADVEFCGNYDLYADFETYPGDEGWSVSDEDSDGYSWGWDDEENDNAHSGTGVLGSYSYYLGNPLNPDNCAYSPWFTVSEGAVLSYWVVAQTPSYLGDHFSVYIETDGVLTELGEKREAPAEMTTYENSLSAYTGRTARIVFRHYDSYDIYGLMIDDVIVSSGVYDAHNYEITWDWAADLTACVAAMTCRNCGRTHTFAADVEFDDSENRYCASFIYDGVTYQDFHASTVPAFRVQSVRLSGEIGINFFMDLSMLTEAQRADTYMTFEISGKGTTTERDDFDADFMNTTGKYYGFTCFVNAIQMADEITATFHYGNGQTVQKTYSVKAYMEVFEANQSAFDETTVGVFHAMADYGHYVQPFLANARGWTVGTDYAAMDKYYTSGYDLDEVRDAVQTYGIVRTIDGEDIADIKYTLSMDSETAIFVYFRPVSGYSGSIAVTIDGAAAAATLQPDGRYLVKIPNISAHLLGTTHTIVATTDSGSATVTVS